MSSGAIIGVLLTIIIAVISSQSGKKKVTKSQPHNVPPPTGNDLPDFWEMMRRKIEEVNSDQLPNPKEITEQEAQSLETPYTTHYQNIEQQSPSLEVIPSEIYPKRGKYEDKPIEHISIMQELHTEQPTFDFDLRNAVIYSEILKPKYMEY